MKNQTYVYFSEGINEKDANFKFGQTVRLSRYKNIFAKGYI